MQGSSVARGLRERAEISADSCLVSSNVALQLEVFPGGNDSKREYLGVVRRVAR